MLLDNLREENKKLKELCDKLEEEHKTTFNEWLNGIKENKKLHNYYNEVMDTVEVFVTSMKDISEKYEGKDNE